MRIAYWTPLFWPEIGGIEIVAARSVLALQWRGHELAVLTSHGRSESADEEVYQGLPVYRFPLLSALSRNDLRQMLAIRRSAAQIVADFSPDIHHINFGGPVPIGYLYQQSCTNDTVPTVVALHGSVRGLLSGNDTLFGRLLARADWITACSAAMLQDAREMLPELTARTSRIYYGIDEPVELPAELPWREPCIVCLGRLVMDKGFDTAIDAMAILSGSHPRLTMVVAGDGPERLPLQNRAIAAGLKNIVEFVEPVAPDDVPALLNRATLVVVPSRWREALGLVAVEAALMARPVIASRVGGLAETVVHGETGLLVEREDVAGFVAAIACLLGDEERARQWGMAGRRRALDVFGMPKYAEAYDELYQRLVAERL